MRHKLLSALVALAAAAAAPAPQAGAWGSGFSRSRVNVSVNVRSRGGFGFGGGFGRSSSFAFGNSFNLPFRQGFAFGGGEPLFRSSFGFGSQFAFRQRIFIAPQVIDFPVVLRPRFVLPEFDVGGSYSAPSGYSSGCSGGSAGYGAGMSYGGGGYGGGGFEAGSFGVAPMELASGFQAGAGFLEGYGDLPLYSRGGDTFAFNLRSRSFFKFHPSRHRFRFHSRHRW